MSFDPTAAPQLQTQDLPGIGGRIKQQPEDFEVEEIPAYEPCGTGAFLYLWIEKRDMGAEYFARTIARRLGIPVSEVGTAGLKDRQAVTRQMVSVPEEAEAQLPQLEGEGLRVLRVSRHGNKLKPGHLHGNRFRILVREPSSDAANLLPPIVERLRKFGVPNYYGLQRFGRERETLNLGLDLLYAAKDAEELKRVSRKVRNPFVRKLALSAGQSALFNHYLSQRLQAGLMHQVMQGDVMAKRPFGGMFVARDLAAEQARFDARETVPAGPIFGRKTFPAEADAAAFESQVLHDAQLTIASFHGFGKLLQGTRRHNLVFPDDLAYEQQPEGIRLTFTLPAGSYATVLLHELMKAPQEAEEIVDEGTSAP